MAEGFGCLDNGWKWYASGDEQLLTDDTVGTEGTIILTLLLLVRVSRVNACIFFSFSFSFISLFLPILSVPLCFLS